MNKYLTFCGIFTLLGCICIVGYLDQQDQAKAESLYCANVRDKIWPDYQGTYKKFCLTQTK